MKFDYRYANPEATHRETGLVIDITYEAQGPGVTFKIANEVGKKLDEVKIDLILEDLRQTVDDERNRSEMQRLVHGTFAGNCSFVEIILEGETSRKVTNRTLQSWLADPQRPSSRKCPAWAVRALKNYIEKEGGQEAVRETNHYIMEQIRERPGGHLRVMARQDGNRRAEERIEREDTQLKRLTNASVSEFPEVIHKRFSDVERERAHDGAVVDIILHALRQLDGNSSIQDFAKYVLEHLDAKFEWDHTVRTTVEELRRGET